MNSNPQDENQVVGSVIQVGNTQLGKIDASNREKIRRRIVGGEAVEPRLDYAAFNSAATT